MRGPVLLSVVAGVILILFLLATMHIWAPWVGAAWRHLKRNAHVAGVAFGDVVKKMTGQGQTRPPGRHSERR